MSRVQPKSGEPVPATPRGSMTPKRRLEILLAYGGRCASCGEKIANKEWIADHILALELGGTDDLGNLQPVHVQCDKPKTAKDKGKIAKLHRQQDMMEPSEPSRMKSRGFETSDKYRGVDGQVRERS